jgi:hypothetical protein
VGTCTFCGQSAGIFHTKHPECVQKHDNGRLEITEQISEAANSSARTEFIADSLMEIARRSFISDAEARNLSVEAWSSAVNRALDHGVLSEEQQDHLVALKNGLSLSEPDLNRHGTWERIVKSAALRDVMNGRMPKRVTVEGGLPLNLQKGEEIVWLFNNSEYLEDRIHRQYVGGSRGLSVRVVKGVYYRVGAFKGQAIDRADRVHVDSGLVVLTNKNIYFIGPRKSLRVSYSNIVSFQPFEDRIGIIRDTTTAKPKIFVTRDGWFTYNLVTNLAQL